MQEPTRKAQAHLAANGSDNDDNEAGTSVPKRIAFSKITFTHPRFVLGETVGMLSTEPNQASRRVDSIEADGYWVLITRGDETRAVPSSCIEEATPLPQPADRR
jgi:hypothetical protein